MNSMSALWKGYDVNGDTAELDAIVESGGIISLDANDIITVLSAEGTKWISAATAATVEEALTEAVNNLPCDTQATSHLLIDFRFGNRQGEEGNLSLGAFPKLLEPYLSREVALFWGITPDNSLGEDFKVVVLAAVPA